MRQLAEWGANTVRLAFSYNDLETEDNPPAWREDGFRQLDDVAQWARRCGIYLILDMHVTPGGQSPQPYCAGGRNSIWIDPAAQEHFVALWSEIARRYHDRPEVAAYELMNEPGTNQKSPDLLRGIDARAITAIRNVDPDKIIVVGGDHGSGPGDLTDAMKFSDPNILYTFHWYVGSGGNADWIGDARQYASLGGTHDWFKVEKTFTVPPRADHLSVMLRSTGNAGSAWFDDVEVKDESGKVVQSSGFDRDTQGYRPEAFPETMSFDPTIGHNKTGSLKEQGTTGFNDWAGWESERLAVQTGKPYHISAWMKLDRATGQTYLGVGFFRINTQIDPAAFAQSIRPAIAFARKYQVPLWVGEFGCDNSDKDKQIQWVNTSIALFEQQAFNWTFWNDKETDDPQRSMGLQTEHPDGTDYPVNERLLSALRAGWKLNQPF